MTLIEIKNFQGERELVRASQIETVALPVVNKAAEKYVHGWLFLLSGRAIGLAEGEAERVLALFAGSDHNVIRRVELTIKD